MTRVAKAPRVAPMDRTRRVLWYVFMGMATLVVASLVAWWFTARLAYIQCAERNARTVATAPWLERMADAAKDDGNPEIEKIWRGFDRAATETPLPACYRPPLTPIHLQADGMRSEGET